MRPAEARIGDWGRLRIWPKRSISVFEAANYILSLAVGARSCGVIISNNLSIYLGKHPFARPQKGDIGRELGESISKSIQPLVRITAIIICCHVMSETYQACARALS
ncbi:MAG: hypothetical protein DCC75_03130 [Proteobacteria bacterium]|nr:MAG: hypothetical protein DCC75_03130 [Pseudomonadota bacterium]